MTIPVLFLHGWTMWGGVFEDVSQRLGPQFTCYAPDLPGHGARQADTPSLAACANLCARWVSRLDRPLLVGWSMGAGAAWRYVSEHGTAGIRGLVTIDMSPRMLPDTDWDLGLAGQSAEAILATSERIETEWPQMAKSISRSMYARDSTPTLTRDAAQDALLAQKPEILRPLWDDLVAMDARQTIAKIDVPYLVCCGAQSRLYSRAVAEWVAQQAAQAEIACFAQSGHAPHLEEPDAFCDAIRSFVAAHRLAIANTEPEKT